MEKSTEIPISYAVASLSLGIVAVFGGIFVIGMPFALVGFILGNLHIKRETQYTGMAKWGAALSVTGLVISILSSYAIYLTYCGMTEKEEAPPEISQIYGKTVSDIHMTSVNGQEINIESLRGKRIALVFWATWCPPCRKEIPLLKRLSLEIPADKLAIISISQEEHKLLEDFSKKEKLPYPVVSRPELPEPFTRVDSIPTIFFINPEGQIENILHGYHDYGTLKLAALGVKL